MRSRWTTIALILSAFALPGPTLAQDMSVTLERQYSVTCANPVGAMQQPCAFLRQQLDTMRRNAAASSGNDSEDVARAPNPYAPTPPVASRFGALPAGVGTDAQRQFWASRCAMLPDDGSSAALGCRQTRDAWLRAPRVPGSPAASPGYAPPSSAVGGLVTAPMAVHCVTLRPVANALGLWQVVNSCGFSVIGRFWYDGAGQTMSASSPGGFGPLRAGATEGVYPPEHGVASYHLRACATEDWNKGVCRF